MGGGGTQTVTEESRKNLPPFLSGAQQNAVGSAFNMTLPGMNTPLYQRAGLNVDQMKAMDLIRGTTQQNYEQGRPSVAGQGVAPFMNPFMQSVIDPAMRNLQNQNNQTQAAIGARGAAAGSFGGSREALQRGMADRTMSDQVASMVPTLLAQGFGNAQQAAGMESGLMDADMRRQLGTAGALGAVGDQQQQFAQSALDVPWQNLQRLLAATPMNQFNQAGTSVKTMPDNSPSPFQQLLGLGMSIAGAPMSGGGSLASRPRSKLFGL
jgi:hypothetical protein